jgi:Lipase maturation factor
MHGFDAPGYWLARLVFQRLLAVVYVVAFVAAARQFRPLLGEHGMLPIRRYVERVPFRRAPSLFQLRSSDRTFATSCWVGAALGLVSAIGLTERLPLAASMVVWLVLWALYLSVVNVGQRWYGFGWETLLLETGFLAVFAGNRATAPPVLVLVLLRWLLFRVEFGAGLIKLRGDPCWRDLTCLRYHHETQPLPNPLSWWFHHLPMPVHRIEVAANHVAQLVVPFALLAPQPVAGAAAAVMIITQGWLMLSGNFSWLNLITITIAVSALGDGFLDPLVPVAAPASLTDAPAWHHALVIAVTAVVAVRSWRPARNLLSRRQLMNSSFDPLHLVNTYGAFGSITRERREIVFEATLDEVPGPDADWRPYECKAKPGDPMRRPPQVAPYHLRLDWLMWFAAISPSYADEWMRPLLRRLLDADPDTLRLFRSAPFGSERPAFVRATLYRYRFTDRRERRATGAWWTRTRIGELVAPTRLETTAR